MTLSGSSDSSTPPRQLAREVIANLIQSSQAPPDITAKAIMQALERQNLAIFAAEGQEWGGADVAFG